MLLSKKDIENLSDSALIKLRDRLIEAADLRETHAARLSEAKARIADLLKNNNLRMDDIADMMAGPAKVRKSVNPAPIKYRDPANAENTWTGRGRKPLWLAAHLEQGKTIDDFLIG